MMSDTSETSPCTIILILATLGEDLSEGRRSSVDAQASTFNHLFGVLGMLGMLTMLGRYGCRQPFCTLE